MSFVDACIDFQEAPTGDFVISRLLMLFGVLSKFSRNRVEHGVTK